MKRAKRQAHTPTAMRVPGVVKAAGAEGAGEDSTGEWDMLGGGCGRLRA
jgi:hypothetical protein